MADRRVLKLIMRILHHITVGGDNLWVSEALRKMGLKLEGSGIRNGPLFFEISEGDPRWTDVAKLIRQNNASEEYLADRVSTEFTQQERDQVNSLSVGICWTTGYPEPSDVAPVAGTRYLPYFASTYDLTNYCPICLTGARQNAPFRLKKAPVWGRRSLFKLNWVLDEIFVKPDVWSTVFRPLGIEFRPVLLHRTGVPMRTIVQLVIPNETDLMLDGFPYKVCPRCGTKKYAPVCRGFSPAPTSPVISISKSHEYFGHGNAFKAILISKALFETAKIAKLRGAELDPCAD